MDLNDLYKLAGISRDDTPAIEPQPVEHVAEQPTDGREDMRAMIALVTPEQLNQLVGEAPVEEGDEYAASTTPNPQEYKGTLGSPSDNSLRRYLGAAGDHVTVDEDVYPDHTVESVSEAYQSFKAEGKYGKKKKYKEEVNEDAGKVGYMEMFFTDRDGGEVSQEVQVTLADGKLSVTGDMPGPEDDLYWDDADIEEQLRDAMKDMSVIDFDMNEADVEENAFNQAAAAASRAGKANFEFGGKTHKTTMKKDVAHKLDDDIDSLKQLAGLPVAEGGMKQADIEVQEWAEKYNTKTGVNGDELANGWLQAMLNSGIMSDSYDQDEYSAFNEKYGFEDDMEWEEDDAIEKFFAESPITRGMHDEANAIMQKYGIDEQDINDMLGYMESKNESAVTEDPSKPNFPMEIKLAGDSIWDKEDQNPKTVTVTDYNMDKDEEGYVSLYVDHNGPWTVYTDSGFEEAISEIIGMDVGFSEQGMQEDGRAHLEGNDEDVTLEQIKKLSGI